MGNSRMQQILQGGYSGEYAGDDELVGAQLAGRAGPAPAGGPSVVRGPLTKIRRTVVGIDSVSTVAAGVTVAITNSPQVIFRPERFIVGAITGTNFIVNDIKIGNDSQFPAGQAVPAEAFVASATDAQLAFKTCQIGQQITVTVTNITAATATRFVGSFFGSIAQP